LVLKASFPRKRGKNILGNISQDKQVFPANSKPTTLKSLGQYELMKEIVATQGKPIPRSSPRAHELLRPGQRQKSADERSRLVRTAFGRQAYGPVRLGGLNGRADRGRGLVGLWPFWRWPGEQLMGRGEDLGIGSLQSPQSPSSAVAVEALQGRIGSSWAGKTCFILLMLPRMFFARFLGKLAFKTNKPGPPAILER